MKYLLLIIMILSFVPSVLAGSEVMIGRIDYGDGTHEAAQVSCTDNGCCEKYIDLIGKKVWKILDLKCYDKEGNFGNYVNGKIQGTPSPNVNKEGVYQEGLLKKADFEARMAESEREGTKSAFWISIITGAFTGIFTGLISSFAINYLFAKEIHRKEVVEKLKSFFRRKKP